MSSNHDGTNLEINYKKIRFKIPKYLELNIHLKILWIKGEITMKLENILNILIYDKSNLTQYDTSKFVRYS